MNFPPGIQSLPHLIVTSLRLEIRNLLDYLVELGEACFELIAIEFLFFLLLKSDGILKTNEVEGNKQENAEILLH
jgi:hypothetical protein